LNVKLSIGLPQAALCLILEDDSLEQSSLLKLDKICKSYYGNQVLKDFCIEINKGEIHGLVGENGAGKSTLMNILFGMPVIQQTGGYVGEVLLEGNPVCFKCPAEAMDYGIGMVHQEFMLIPGFSVAENIKLNRERTRPNLVSRIFGQKLETVDVLRNRKEARVSLDRLGMSFDETMSVGGLTVSYMQFIKVAREIDKENTKIVVFDEPTAVSTESEAEQFLGTARKLADDGMGVLYSSHRLDEVVSLCDRITILRDGEVVAVLNRGEVSVERIAELMVGRQINRLAIEKKTDATNKPILEIRNFSGEMPGERVENINLDIYEGEILGIGGLAAHGKIGIANGIMGMYSASGSVVKKSNRCH